MTKAAPRINTVNMERLLEQIIAEGKRHQQEWWGVVTLDPDNPAPVLYEDSWGDAQFGVTCPTAACAAGWMCFIAGDTGVADAGSPIGPTAWAKLTKDGVLSEAPVRTLSLTRVIPAGQTLVSENTVSIESRAKSLLGLSHHQGSILFEALNTRAFVQSTLRRTIVHAKRHPDARILVAANGAHHDPVQWAHQCGYCVRHGA
ncbi:hypothetical protein [Mycolicibacterium fortuitum]|uniref:hypothetical protein n=1 Tax=Mycolicibacterium fortuitum TaxID=1766 RepID=UPI0026117206|nr:hypothetical protein [Mycolicibacterium fortuitum]